MVSLVVFVLGVGGFALRTGTLDEWVCDSAVRVSMVHAVQRLRLVIAATHKKPAASHTTSVAIVVAP